MQPQHHYQQLPARKCSSVRLDTGGHRHSPSICLTFASNSISSDSSGHGLANVRRILGAILAPLYNRCAGRFKRMSSLTNVAAGPTLLKSRRGSAVTSAVFCGDLSQPRLCSRIRRTAGSGPTP